LLPSKDKEIITLYQEAYEAFEKGAYKKAIKKFWSLVAIHV
jgi:outer membrane protein assembly factor BamD (BamD/ComL family)